MKAMELAVDSKGYLTINRQPAEVRCRVVWKLDRFGRSLRHLVNAIAELEAIGVSFISFRDNLDLITPSGRAPEGRCRSEPSRGYAHRALPGARSPKS